MKIKDLILDVSQLSFQCLNAYLLAELSYQSLNAHLLDASSYLRLNAHLLDSLSYQPASQCPPFSRTLLSASQ